MSPHDFIDAISRFIQPLVTRVANTVARAVVKNVDDSTKMQLLQVSILAGEVRDEVPRVQNYGFTSVPDAGAEAVLVCVGGRRDHALAIAVDDRRYRPKNLNAGEVACYHKSGSIIVFKDNGDIEITPKAGQAFKIVGDVDLTGNLNVTGDVGASGDVTAGAISLSTHTHGAGTFTSSPTGGPITGASGGPS